MLMQACNRGASRLGEAWAKPGEAWARPRLGRKTYWYKDKARLMGTRNTIVEVPGSPRKAELEVVGACAALLEF